LVLTNVDSQDELLLVGLENVLNDVTVTVSNPHFMYAGRPYNKGDLRTWPIGLKSVFWTEGTPGDEMSLTINSPITGQNFVVPVKAAFRADQCANIELGWSSVLYFIAAHYQSLLFIIASCIVCVIITKFVSQAANKSSSSSSNGTKPPSGDKLLATPLNNRLHQNGSPNTLLNSESKPFLWTTNESPVYGSPTSTSPYGRGKSPRQLAQYSYSNH